MKFNVSVLSFGLVILALNLVLVTSDSSIGDDSSIVELSAPSIDKVRVSRRTTNCGVQTFKLLTLICANEFKFPVERQVIKDINSNEQLLNYETPSFNKRSTIQTSLSSSDLLNEQPFNLKRMVDYNTLQESIPDVHVHNNPNYHRIKRSLIRDCCHKSCTLKELENLC